MSEGLKRWLLVMVCVGTAADLSWGGVTNHVSLDSASPLPPYLTWEHAAHSVSAAVAAATSGDLVLVSNGLHTVTSEILVTNDITVRGFGGRDETIVARIGDPAVTTRIFKVTAAGAVLDTLTISNGMAKGKTPGTNNKGAGVWLEKGTLTNCVVTRNRWVTPGGLDTTYGGGAYVGSGSVLNCTFNYNDAYVDGAGYNSGVGGALYVVSGLVANCTIGPTNRAGSASGIYIARGMLRNCSVFNSPSVAGSAGVGLVLGGSDIVVDSCVISNNNGGSGGGNIQCSGYSPTLRNCEVVAGYDSSVSFANSSSLIENCKFHHINSPWRSAVRTSTNVTLRNCLFYAITTSDRSAAFYLDGGKAENCTFTANNYTATGIPGAGGVIVTNALLLNCIVYSNWANSYSAGLRQHDLIALAGAILSNNCSRDVTQGVDGNLTGEPQFESYAGGYGVAAAGGNFRPRSTSPCLGAAVAQAWMSAAQDLDGRPRIFSGRVDMGAYQYVPPGSMFSCR